MEGGVICSHWNRYLLWILIYILWFECFCQNEKKETYLNTYCMSKSHQVYANSIASVSPISLLLIREVIVHKMKCANEFLFMEYTDFIIFPIMPLNS